MLRLMLYLFVLFFKPTLGQECRCGEENFVNAQRVVGGSETPPMKYVFPAAIVNEFGNHFCGTAWLCRRFTVTAAHCVAKRKAAEIWVAAGAHNIRREGNPRPTYFAVEYIRIHEDYNPTTVSNDIALLKTRKPADIDGKLIRAVCLPHPDLQLFDGYKATVMGWGKTKSVNLGASDVLREVELSYFPPQKCIEKFKKGSKETVDKTMLCFGDEVERRDACQGDSGGPLVMKCLPSRKWIQVGVVSWGIGCANMKYPGVYANMMLQSQWLQDNVDGDCVLCEHTCNKEGGFNTALLPSNPGGDTSGIPDNLAEICGLRSTSESGRSGRGLLRNETMDESDGQRTKRFVGADRGTSENNPWMVVIMYESNKAMVASGFLITDRWVVTSGNAIYLWKDYRANLRVHLGKSSVNDQSGRVVKVKSIHPHPRLNQPTENSNDVGMVKLMHSVALSESIRPICLPRSNPTGVAVPDGIEFLFAGFGQFDQNSLEVPTLHAGTVNTMALLDCQQQFKMAGSKAGIQGQRHFCTFGNRGKEICKNDQGSATFHCDKDNKCTAFGMALTGTKTVCNVQSPFLHLQLAPYVDWMALTIRAN